MLSWLCFNLHVLRRCWTQRQINLVTIAVCGGSFVVLVPRSQHAVDSFTPFEDAAGDMYSDCRIPACRSCAGGCCRPHTVQFSCAVAICSWRNGWSIFCRFDVRHDSAPGRLLGEWAGRALGRDLVAFCRVADLWCGRGTEVFFPFPSFGRFSRRDLFDLVQSSPAKLAMQESQAACLLLQHLAQCP